MDDLQGLPNNLRNELIDLQEKPLKWAFKANYNAIIKQIISMIKSQQIIIL